MIASGALLKYLLETQKQDLSHITNLTVYNSGRYMLLDSSTRRNLELCETLREKQKRGSLLWVLDKTKTAMGARTLHKCIEQPLITKKEIEERLDAVEEFKEQAISRRDPGVSFFGLRPGAADVQDHLSFRQPKGSDRI